MTMLAVIAYQAYWLDILWSYSDPTWPRHTEPHIYRIGVGGGMYITDGGRVWYEEPA